MRTFSNRSLPRIVAVALVFLSVATLRAQESESETVDTPQVSPLDEEGRLVRFERDIAPILRQRCLECHGPDDAKNDFRVDDVDSLMQYVEAEDIESSSIYVDYLVSEDEDILMPPVSHGGPLSPSELALIRVWIEEGAVWPEEYVLVAAGEGSESTGATVETTTTESSGRSMTLGERIWIFQGYLHPATIHFPIAFFLLGGGFVVLGWKWPSVGTQIPLACLLLGAVTSVAATLMGWAFAPVQGYGSGWNPMDWSREVDVHRWSAVIVTVTSVIVAIMALIALWKDSDSLTRFWKIGLLALAGMVGAVGHQGGEMSYGANFYPKAFEILLGTDEEVDQVATTNQELDVAADIDAPDSTPRQTAESIRDESAESQTSESEILAADGT